MSKLDEFKQQESSELDQRLLELVKEARSYSPKTRERRQKLNEIVALMQQSGRIWRGTVEHGDGVYDYQDALQKSWLYFCRNLCEVTTARDAYNPDKGSVINWFNAHLKFRLKPSKKKFQTVRPYISEDGELVDPVDRIPAPPEIPSMLEAVHEWLEREVEQLQQIHVRKRPDINCYVLIQHRLPPETSWEELAKKFDSPLSTLEVFYFRKCFPRLIEFGESEGYL
ncbi:MAG: sigma-70 family RNA polymerase sigma factor [Leptolyngbyaceae cyanobacterium bins.302]|nr:sigma-70 family RNA polymerase sigma factor [Leptolyngbyaceae cyanobacterium bins.302]